MGDAAFIFIPDNGTYDIQFTATGNGSFDFRVRKFENENTSQEILYNDVPLTTSTKAELTFNTSSSQSPIMYVDEDGNGTTDQEINQFIASTSTPTSAPTSAPTPTPTPTPIPTPTSIVIVKSNEREIENEDNIVSNKAVSVAGAADINTDIPRNSEREEQDSLAVLVLGIMMMPQLLSQVVFLPFLKKFW